MLDAVEADIALRPVDMVSFCAQSALRSRAQEMRQLQLDSIND